MAKQEQTSLTKQGMINILRENHDMTAEKSRTIVEDLVEAMCNSVVKDGYLSIKDFGTFTVVERAGRTVNHPATQQKVKIKAHKSLRFKMAAALQEKVRKKGKLPAIV